jgi:hypothetical protein
MDKLLREAVAVDAEQKKQEWVAEKKQKEEAEKKRRAEEAVCKASVESAKRKAGSSKGKSKEVVVESDDDSEGPEFPKTKKRKLAGRKSKTDKSVVEAVVSCVQ